MKQPAIFLLVLLLLLTLMVLESDTTHSARAYPKAASVKYK